MGVRRIFSIVIVTCSILPYISFSIPIDDEESSITSENDYFPRDSRQLSFLTSPFRRVANSTRTIVKFIREYGTARLTNGTTPKPQTNAGRRAVAVLQHVTLGNIKDAVSTLANSEAGPVVVDFFRNIDRDVLQLFNSHSRTAPPLLLRLRTTTTTKPPKTKIPRTRTPSNTTESSTSNSTSSSISEKKIVGNGTSTIASVLSENSTKRYALSVVEHIKSNADNSGTEKSKVTVNEVEDDEDDSTEDD